MIHTFIAPNQTEMFRNLKFWIFSTNIKTSNCAQLLTLVLQIKGIHLTSKNISIINGYLERLHFSKILWRTLMNIQFLLKFFGIFFKCRGFSIMHQKQTKRAHIMVSIFRNMRNKSFDASFQYIKINCYPDLPKFGWRSSNLAILRNINNLW